MDRYPLTDFWLQVLRHVFIVRQRTSGEMDSSRLVDFAKFFSFAKLRKCRVNLRENAKLARP